MQLINATPHPIAIYSPHGILELPPSGSLARVRTHSTPIGEAAGVQIVSHDYEDVSGLPEPQPNTLVVVSSIVLNALKEKGCKRKDVVSPDTSPVGGAIRDAKGRVQGITRLVGLPS